MGQDSSLGQAPNFAGMFRNDSGEPDDAAVGPLTPRVAVHLWVAARQIAVALGQGGPSPHSNLLHKALAADHEQGTVELIKANSALLEDIESGEEPFPRSLAEIEALRLIIVAAESNARGDDPTSLLLTRRLLEPLPIRQADLDTENGRHLQEILAFLTDGALEDIEVNPESYSGDSTVA